MSALDRIGNFASSLPIVSGTFFDLTEQLQEQGDTSELQVENNLQSSGSETEFPDIPVPSILQAQEEENEDYILTALELECRSGILQDQPTAQMDDVPSRAEIGPSTARAKWHGSLRSTAAVSVVLAPDESPDTASRRGAKVTAAREESAPKRRREEGKASKKAKRTVVSPVDDLAELLRNNVDYLQDEEITNLLQGAPLVEQDFREEARKARALSSLDAPNPLPNPDWVANALECPVLPPEAMLAALTHTQVLQNRSIMASLEEARIETYGRDDLEASFVYGNRCAVLLRHVAEVSSNTSELARNAVQLLSQFPTVICLLIVRPTESSTAPHPWTDLAIRNMHQLPGTILRNFAVQYPDSQCNGVDVLYAPTPRSVGRLLRGCAERAVSLITDDKERFEVSRCLTGNSTWMGDETDVSRRLLLTAQRNAEDIMFTQESFIKQLRQGYNLTTFAAMFILSCGTIEQFLMMSDIEIIKNFGPVLGYDVCEHVIEMFRRNRQFDEYQLKPVDDQNMGLQDCYQFEGLNDHITDEQDEHHFQRVDVENVGEQDRGVLLESEDDDAILLTSEEDPIALRPGERKTLDELELDHAMQLQPMVAVSPGGLSTETDEISIQNSQPWDQEMMWTGGD